jgi:hypothetical protein
MGRFFLRVWHWLRAEIVFGFLIGSVFWAAVLVWQAAYAPTDAEKQKCYDAAHNAGHKSEECKSFWERSTSDPVAFFTLVLAFSTIGLWVATIFLYRAGEKQSRHTRRSAAIQARDMQASLAATRDATALAYPSRVLIKNVAICRPDETDIRAFIPGERIDGEAWVVHLGHEPITIHRIWCMPYWRTGPLPMKQPYYKLEDSRPFIDPDTHEVLQGEVRPGAIGCWRFETIVPDNYNPAMQFYVIGIFIYRDRLGVYRNTHFARRYERTECRFIAEPNNIDYETHE